ncbi:MAG: periplasmic heavy metal sensor [Chitinivibrionales bacterium]|nr:periplasmic heavy metal sensor [Chitinivibrionales bacterium]
MKTKTITFLLIILTAINITGFGFMIYHRFFTRPSYHRAPGLMRHGPRGLIRDLELKPEQRQKIFMLRKKIHRETSDIRNSLRDSQKSLLGYVQKENPDTAAIDSILKTISRYQYALHRKAIYGMMKEKGILTPEQREKMMKRFERRIEQCGPRFPGMPPDGKERRHLHGRMGRGPFRKGN